MSKPTPGPWTTEPAPHRAWIAKVGNNRGDPEIWTERQAKPGESYEWGDKWADARLIAAAPDLLAALQRAITYVELTYNDEAGEEAAEARHDLDICRAAIRKAEGK